MCAGNYETVDHLIWHSERFWLERHRLIDALNVSIVIPIREFNEFKRAFFFKFALKTEKSTFATHR
jgi:hypothetical protein